MPSKNLPPTIGRYEVVDRLGHGGMGVVYRARDARIGGRFVAVKLLRVTEEAVRDRFLREAGTAGNLKHPNIVTIYDYGEHDGQPFIVMEYVEGVTLSEIIRSKFELSLSRKLEILEALVNGLDYAHNRGIVHRDIKPANVMIDRDDVLKILDFGIARVGDSSVTQVGTMMGTPNYMSPEQVEGRIVDRRSDIFAVGLVFYELLSYRQAFTGETVHRVLNSIVRDTPSPIAELCPGLDPAIEAIVERAIRKDPLKRYQTLGELADELSKIENRTRKTRSSASASSLSTTVMTPPPAAPQTGGRPSTHRDVLSKRRADRIERLLPTAQKAFEAGDFEAAIDACEEAALLDPDEPRVVTLLEQARAGLQNRQIQDWLFEARQCLDRGDRDKASELVDRAVEKDPASAAAQSVRDAIEEFSRRHREELERQELISAALARARAGLSNGQLESAIRAAGEILARDPTHGEAHEVTREALRRLEERREREALDKAARAAVERQQQAFAAGQRREAIEELERFAPPHEVVTTALADMRRDLADLERRAAEEEARQRRAAAEAEQRRQAQQRWALRQVDLAKSSIESHQFSDAIEVLRHLEQAVPDVPGLAALLKSALDGQAALEAEAQRARELDEKVAVAAEKAARGQLAEARALLHEVLAAAPDHAKAIEYGREVESAIAAKAREEAIERDARAAIQTAERHFEAGDHAKALALLESFVPPHPLVARARENLTTKAAALEREAERARQEAEKQRLEAEARARADAANQAVTRAERALAENLFDDAIRALDEADALNPQNPRARAIRARAQAGREEAHRKAEHERLARTTAAAARQHVAAGDVKGALKLLEHFSPPHPIVAEVLAELRAELAAREAERLKAEEEKRRRAEAEREARIATANSQARTEMEEGRFGDALARLQQLESAEGRVPAVRKLVEEVRAAQAAAEAQAREAERRRQQTEEERRQQIERAHQEAERQRLEAEARARADAADQAVARAEVALAQQAFDAAMRALDEAEALGQGNRRVAAVRARVQAAREEQRRIAEHERQAHTAAGAARQRFAAGDIKAAFKLLERFSPPHAIVSETLAELRAELAAQEAERLKAEEEKRRRAEAERAARIANASNQARAELAEGRYSDALKRLQRLESAEGRDPSVRTLIEEIQAAQSRAAQAREAERKRQEERQKLEAAEQREARDRQQKITTALNRARSAGSAYDAVLILREALQLAPDHSGCRDLLAARQAEMISEAERLVEDGQFARAMQALERIDALGISSPNLAELREQARSGQEAESPSFQPTLVNPDVGVLPVPPHPVPAPRPVDWKAALWLAGAAVLFLTLGLIYWLTMTPSRPPDAVDVTPMVAEARRHLGSGDLAAAARAIVPALNAAPQNPDVVKSREEILGAAEGRANAAKSIADSSGAQNQSEYGVATKHRQTAEGLRRSGRSEDVEPAVREYASAADLYRKSLPATVDTAPIVGNATALIKQGNYSQAARDIVEGLKSAPGNAALQGTLLQALAGARASADSAKRVADAAGASSQRDYIDANTQSKFAASSGASEHAEDKASAVEHYVAAAQKYFGAVNTHALAMFKQGNLNAAVRAAATGLAAAPGHTDLRKTLQEILSGAEASANNARRAADASGVASRPEYGDASTRLKSADTSRRSGRSDDAEAAVRDYVAASQLYSAAVTRHAQTVLKQGNLAGATRVIVLGLGVLPGQGEFQKTLQEIFDAAEAGATGARRAADAAGASGRPEYVNATSQFTAASNARRSGRADGAEAAVRDFAAAEKLYKDAAAAAPPPPPPGVGPIVNSAKNFINIGNLTGAARTIAGGLKDFPKNSELLGTLQQVYGTAETEANTARKAADAAGASSRSEYAEGTSRLRSATNARSGRPEDAESVVRDYAAATKFYRDAERLGKEAVGGGGGGAISDEAAVRQVLAEYAVAYSSMDVARVRRVRPAFKPYDQNLRATELTISNPIVEFRDRETAVVTLTIQYRNAYRKGSFATDPPPQRVTWLLRRTNEGWKIQG